MNTHGRVAVLAVAAMLLLAGCGGSGGGGETPVDGSPASGTPASTATPTPEMTLSTVTYPDGLSRDGFENATLFLSNHRDAMTSGPSYAVRMDVTAGQETQTLRASTDPESERIRSQTDRNGELDYDIYYADGTQYVRQVTDSGGRYGTTNATFRSAAEGLNGGQFLTTIVLLDLEATDVTRQNGETVIAYDILGPRSSAEGIAQASGTVQITTDGQIVAMEYDLVSSDDRAVSVTWERTAVGETTVENPDWIDQARNA